MLAKSLIVALLGASVAQAHMIMTNPVPYSKDSLNNSPLAADGSDFPCKLRSNTFDVTKENTLSIGETTNMTFEGSATHGGGSCQISLTTDRQPTKDSEWKVIKSFEGGCPANVDGNLSGGESAADPSQFEFSIPDGIEAGKYTLAWTWFNRIGNREMYMNCAPLTVEGGSSKRSEPEPRFFKNEEKEKRSSSFPPMFVANVNGCTTKESVDIRFPNPGDDVEYLGQPANLAPKGSTACTGTPSFGGAGNTPGGSSSGGSSSGSGSGSSGGSGSSSAAPAPTSSAAPAPSSAPAPAETTTPAAPQAPQPAPTSSAPASPSSSGSSSGSGSAESGACTTEGAWNCIGGSTFQRCASGQWTSPQQMASGTTCTAGQGSELSVKAAVGARAVSEMRFRKRIIGSHHA